MRSRLSPDRAQGRGWPTRVPIWQVQIFHVFTISRDLSRNKNFQRPWMITDCFELQQIWPSKATCPFSCQSQKCLKCLFFLFTIFSGLDQQSTDKWHNFVRNFFKIPRFSWKTPRERFFVCFEVQVKESATLCKEGAARRARVSATACEIFTYASQCVAVRSTY